MRIGIAESGAAVSGTVLGVSRGAAGAWAETGAAPGAAGFWLPGDAGWDTRGSDGTWTGAGFSTGFGAAEGGAETLGSGAKKARNFDRSDERAADGTGTGRVSNVTMVGAVALLVCWGGGTLVGSGFGSGFGIGAATAGFCSGFGSGFGSGLGMGEVTIGLGSGLGSGFGSGFGSGL